MDHFNHPNSKVHHNHSLSHNSNKKMKTSIQFLLCFSLFCVFFSSLPLFLQFAKPFLMQFFIYMVEKSYMFLLCNGLLALIAMNSGLVYSSSPPTTHHSIEQHRAVVEVVGHTEKSILLDTKESDIAVAAPIVGSETEYPQEEEKVLFIVEQENVVSSSPSEMQEEENAVAIIEEDELAVDDNEELNKKCEDFIKRMKATFSSNNLELRAVDSFYFANQNSLVAVVN